MPRCPSCGRLGCCSSELAHTSGGQLAVSESGLGSAGVMALCVFYPPEGMPGHAFMAMTEEQECEQVQLCSTFEASACIIFADIPITKVSHVARSGSPGVSVGQSTGKPSGWIQALVKESHWLKKWIPLGVLVSMGSRRVGLNWAAEQQQQHSSSFQMSTMYSLKNMASLSFKTQLKHTQEDSHVNTINTYVCLSYPLLYT